MTSYAYVDLAIQLYGSHFQELQVISDRWREMRKAPNYTDLQHRKSKFPKRTQHVENPHTKENKKHKLPPEKRQRAPIARSYPPSFECPGIPLVKQEANLKKRSVEPPSSL